jgi:hypothetical protein
VTAALAYFLLAGLLTDFFVGQRASKQPRPYRLMHFVLAFVLGWLILPAILVTWVYLTVIWMLTQLRG